MGKSRRKINRSNKAKKLRSNKRKAAKSKEKGYWEVTFNDGTKIKTGYYPNPRMAIGEALKQHKGKVKDVKYKQR